MRLLVKGKDITNLVKDVVWTGADENVARKLEFSLISSPIDQNIPKVVVALGDFVQLYDDGKEIFQGFIWNRETAYDSTYIKIIAFEGSIYLKKNWASYNFKNMLPEDIATYICNDFNIPAGKMAKTGVPQSYIVLGDKDLYEIIMMGYQMAGNETGREYKIVMNNGKVEVIEKDKVVLKGNLKSSDLSNITMSETLDEMVNIVKIIDEEGNTIGEINNSEWVTRYGSLQKVVKYEADKNVMGIAENLLKGIEQSVEIEFYGDSKYISGHAVEVEESYTGVIGIFRIIEDTHTWENGLHKVKLKLKFITRRV